MITRRLVSSASHWSTRNLATVAAYDQTVQSFPSLLIDSTSVTPFGSFAETQARYLDPDPESVSSLQDALKASRMGVVAHYYMDVELQGVLQKAGAPIGIADSLRMGDMAVEMCKQHDLQAIACLGVDFMAESVQAILRQNGVDVPVYRATPSPIGCSLAESAERDSYRAWLQQAPSNSLHVIYINTSLETKAVSSSLVPTITCTSSNVLQTILTASAQISDLNLLYGPDTYMGENLVTLLNTLTQENSGWDDKRVAKDLHASHSMDSLRKLRDSINVFPSGNCVVHHMFGASVVQTVRDEYDDCFVTAHLEVPGEMFEIAMEKSLSDTGVVGSTSDILNFVSRKVQESAARGSTDRLRFILGTEAGMVTSIVQSVQEILKESSSNGVECEVIFPVASDAVMGTDNPDMAVVPGVAGGEGCSTAGGCATCPFMKMNDLDALMNVLQMVEEGGHEERLQKHLPPNRLEGRLIDGKPATELGIEAIMYMRDFMKQKQIPAELVRKVSFR